MKSSTATNLDELTRYPAEVHRVGLLEDRLAVLAVISNDCAELIARGETIPDEIWRSLRRIALCAEHGLSAWRQVPYYHRARIHIRAAITDINEQLDTPR